MSFSSESSSSTYHLRFYQDSQPHVSWQRQLLNLAGCLLILPLYSAATANTLWPMTVDLLISICLTELCRFINEGRRIAFREGEGAARTTPRRLREKEGGYEEDVEKYGAGAGAGIDPAGDDADPVPEAIAMIVGWREDPGLWERCLESYKKATGCRFVLAGIDGNDADDKEMVDVFQKVYPKQSLVISLPEPLGEVANAICARERHVRQKLGGPAAVVDEEEVREVAMQACLALARNQLEEALERHDTHLGGRDGVRHLLVNQRHLHKKGIMFTSLVFAIVVADMCGLEFLWTSDSDTVVFPDSLERTVNTVAGDPRAGGAGSALVVHNAADSVVAKLSSIIYWCELYLCRSQPGSAAVSDCQSGPAAAFRLSALRPILVAWYNQTIFGKRMIVNEDRHLTTLLLLRGWRVIYASDVMTATETPTTLVRWVRQQVRWGRSGHIESLLHPRVYILSHPFLFLSAVRRELVHLVLFAEGLLYLFTPDRTLLSLNMPDLALRVGGTAAYNFLRNPDRQTPSAMLWMVPGLLFFNVPLPGVQAWSLLTMTADTWGTSMRSGTEIAKRDGLRKRWFESGFFVAWMGAVGAMLAKWAASRLLLTAGQTLLWELVAAAVCGGWIWKLTIHDA